MIKVLITGPIMPPAGGISIHILRLKNLLHDEFNFDFIDESTNFKREYYNIRSLNLIKYLQKIIQADILFIHSGNNFFKKLHIISGKLMRKKIIITIHGYRKKKKWFFRNVDKYIYELSDKIILVNNQIFDKLPLNNNSKCIIRNAFLPPVMKDEILKSDEILKWIQTAKEKNKILLCANASRLDLHNNEDLYGLDMCIELIRRLIGNKYEVSMIYVVTSLDRGIDRFYGYIDKINSYNLGNHLLLINENVSFVRIIEASDIVLRPTNIDGDAVTIREAIYLNKPVVASDAVNRPNGITLFKNRDFDDFEVQLIEQIIKLRKHNNTISSPTSYNNTECKEFYSKLIKSL